MRAVTSSSRPPAGNDLFRFMWCDSLLPTSIDRLHCSAGRQVGGTFVLRSWRVLGGTWWCRLMGVGASDAKDIELSSDASTAKSKWSSCWFFTVDFHENTKKQHSKYTCSCDEIEDFVVSHKYSKAAYCFDRACYGVCMICTNC